MIGSRKYFILFVAFARVLYSKGPREKNLKSSENKTLTIFFDYAFSTMKCALIFCICSCAYVYETSCNLMACFF